MGQSSTSSAISRASFFCGKQRNHFGQSQIIQPFLLAIPYPSINTGVFADKVHDTKLTDLKDIWAFFWGISVFSSKKGYQHFSGHRHVHVNFWWLWKSSCQNKHKVFFWLLLHNRLSTRNILRRKSMHLPSYNCVLCSSGIEETLSHQILLLIPYINNYSSFSI